MLFVKMSYVCWNNILNCSVLRWLFLLFCSVKNGGYERVVCNLIEKIVCLKKIN